MIGALLLTASLMLNPPDDLPSPSESFFTVPTGSMPWSLPVVPEIELEMEPFEAPEISMEHSDAFSSMLSEMESYTTRIEDMATSVEEASEFLVGATSQLPPTMVDGALQTDLDLGGTDVSTTTVVGEVATKSAYVVAYARALVTDNTLAAGSTGFAYWTMMILVLWMVGITILKSFLHFMDAVVSTALVIIEKLKPLVEAIALMFGA